jgi:hypothetical protein
MPPLESSTWQGLGAIISAVGVVIGALVTLLVYWLTRTKRRLVYSVSPPSPILKLPNASAHNIELRVNGQVLAEPRLVVVRVRNSGRAEIEPADFSMPLAVNFGQDVTVFSVYARRLESPHSPIPFKTGIGSVTVEPLLLSCGDSIELVCLVGSNVPEPAVHAHVKGVRRLTRLSEDDFASPGAQRAKVISVAIAFAVAIASGILANFTYSSLVSPLLQR